MPSGAIRHAEQEIGGGGGNAGPADSVLTFNASGGRMRRKASRYDGFAAAATSTDT